MLSHQLATSTGEQQCPRKQITQKPEATVKLIPRDKYVSRLSAGIFDPSTVNTPPNEFMKHLKDRLQVYYQS